MGISQNKIKALGVFILAIGIGIGVPLFSRLQPTQAQTSVLGSTGKSSLVAIAPPPTISCSGVQTPPNVGDTTATITWTSVISWGTVDIYYWMGDQTFGKGGSTIQITYPLSGGSASVTPYAAVKPDPPATIDTQVSGSPCTVTFQTASSAPAAPSNLTLGTVTADAAQSGTYDATLNWNTVSGATNYIVKTSLTSGGPYVPVQMTANPPLTFLKVNPGTYYDVVTATKGGPESANSNEITAVIPPATPTPPPPPPAPSPTPTPPPAPSGPVCGNGICESGEDANSCSQDCPVTSGGTSGSDQTGSSQDLTPAPNILTCKVTNSNIIISENQISVVRCSLIPPGIITAWIIKGAYTPPSEPDPTTVVSTLLYQKSTFDQNFSFNWNGIDSYDQPAPDGSYTAVVFAQQSAGAKPDISIQNINVMFNPPPQTQQTSDQTQQPGLNPAAPTPPATPPAPPAAPPTPPPPPTPSKCPGVNYPSDIGGHWAKDFIRLAYDYCIFRGYGDGTFHPDQTITRAESVKASLVAAGVPPKLGCYTTDCGSPFKDLIPWESQWVRAAWSAKIVIGVSKNLFAPQRNITRGEAVVLIAKAFKIAPHLGCFTANCGAGYPNDFFLDVSDKVLGSYLRALWDMKIIQGTGPNIFEPNRSMTRAEMATVIIKVAQVLGKVNIIPPQQTPPSAPPPATGSSQQPGSTQQ